MHSTLSEIRLIQRSLKTSCRYCSARNQSPRRAFHRGSALRSSQEPSANAGNGAATPSGEEKDGMSRESSVAHDSSTSAPSSFPVKPPPVTQHGSGPSESDQNSTNAFYGSSFNRRQRVRAQQEGPTEPPFTTPQWFVDSNVTLWSANTTDSLIEHTDEWNFDALEARGRAAGGSGTPGETPTVGDDGSETALHTQNSDAAEGTSTNVPNTHTDTGEGESAQEPRYFLGTAQWDEISTTVRGLLNTSTSNTQYQTEPAVKANHLLLHYAGRDGEYLLDEVVRQLAAENGSNVVDIDVQDIADLVSRARARDPSAAEGRMLSYELLAAPAASFEPTEPKESLEEQADEEDMESFGLPFTGGGSSPPMIIGKPFTIDLSDLSKSLGWGRTGSTALSRKLASASFPANSMQQSGQGFRMLAPPRGPFHSIVDGILATVHEKEQQSSQPDGELRSQRMETSGLQRESTIIHIRDIKATQNTTVGGLFLKDLYTAVESRRLQGENIILIGTECAKESIENPTSAIDSLQRTPMPPEISRTIVIMPIVPNKHFHDNLLEDRRRRIATINLRHVWEMMTVWNINRPNPEEQFLNLAPGFWKRNIYDELSSADQQRLNKHVWSFQYVHRIVSYLRGISDYGSFVASHHEETTEESTIVPIINSVAKRLSLSDGGKVAWAQRASTIADTFKARNPKTAKKMDELSKISRIRSSATKHEKRLLNGVIEPAKINTTFDDVHAPRETIDALQTLTTLSLINPEAFQYGVLASDRIPGLLLYGPPGTGKTLLAKAVAKESGATMLEVSAADLNDMYVGEGEKNVKALFSLAKKLSPCVVFLDEADAMFSARSAAGRRVSHRELLNQFLKEWDGMSNDSGSAFLMVATNRPMDFDDAVLRRLPRRLLIDLPTENDRHEILKIHLKAEQLASDVKLADLAKRTPFYSGSDLKNLCVAAALTAVREQVYAADRTHEARAAPLAGEAAASAAPPDASGNSSSSPTPQHQDQTTGNTWTTTPLSAPRRILTNKHFERALEEITASVSEDMNSLKEIKKFDEVYGDRRGRAKKGRGPKWGFRGVEEGKGETGDTVKVRE